MTLSRSAAFVPELVDPLADPYDLRHLFLSPAEASAPRRTGRSRRALRKVGSTGSGGSGDTGDDQDTDEDLEDEDFDEAEDDSQHEAEDETAEDDSGGDEDDAGHEEEEDVRNSKGRNLSRESARYRVAARSATAAAQAATERATAAEDALRGMRLQLAFLRAAQAAGFAFANDEAAFKIGDFSKVTIADDGTVTGMDTAVELLADDHSYLLADGDNGSRGTRSSKRERDRLADLPASGGTNNRKKKGTDQPSSEVLRQKFPALRTRR